MSFKSNHQVRGFALVITLALLALLVLAVLALSALVRVSGQVATTGGQRVQARQNALLALHAALGELQRHAGDDSRLTGMAGITGIAAGAANSTRHWCGVWRSDGSFITWLVSGAQASTAALQPGVVPIQLINTGSVGAAAANSEHVIAGKIPIVVTETPGTPGAAARTGSYAYLVSDEGVKTPAYAPAPLPAVPPVIFAGTANAQSRLRDALNTYSARLSRVISYEQLALLPSPAGALTPSTLQDNFHHTTLTNRFLTGGQLRSGMFNVNTNSVIAWRNLLQTYNTVPGISTPVSAATITARGTTIHNAIAGAAHAGKAANAPFRSFVAVGDYLTTVFPATGSPTAAEIMTAIGPMLALRSDTFRIRAYGDALHPVDPGKIESSAWCEAIVQRTGEPAGGTERRFTVIYFRWLGPDDL